MTLTLYLRNLLTTVLSLRYHVVLCLNIYCQAVKEYIDGTHNTDSIKMVIYGTSEHLVTDLSVTLLDSGLLHSYIPRLRLYGILEVFRNLSISLCQCIQVYYSARLS